MKVITAVENTECLHDDPRPSIFMAGGITNCPWWQDDLIKLLDPYDNAILINPRRRNFPINDPNAAREQIKWEFNELNACSIFSMWFSAGPSDQPICMYELGRHIEINYPFQIAIGVEPGYKREQDVYIQTELVDAGIASRITKSLEDHAKEILSAVEQMNPKQY